MKILLTNDDGFDAPGIKSLYETFSKDHEVYILAPAKNNSGASCKINLFSDHELTERGKNQYSLDGSPVDCVMVASKGSFIPEVDLVISGINNGGNLGTDVIYSGTCGAARQAALYNIPAVSVSLEKLSWLDTSPYKFDVFSQFLLKNLDIIYKYASMGKSQIFTDSESGEKYQHNYFLNINAPSVDAYKGVKWASFSHRMYDDDLSLSESVKGVYSAQVYGKECGIKSLGLSDNDSKLLHMGYVTLTLIRAIPEHFNPEDKDTENLFVL